MAPPRIWLIDVARTLALLGMAVFHFVFDLQMFGVVPDGTSVNGFFYWFARAVAGSFLFLAGLSLWFSHGGGIRWPLFWRRWIRIAAAAALVSLATRIAMPQAWVFFGILHAIAAFSLLGLVFLRLPAPVTLILSAAVMAGSYVLPGLLQWNAPLLSFLGLGQIRPFSVDFEPVFPWFGPFLLGIAAGGLLRPAWPALAQISGPAALAWPGRHSLVIYLIHQPVLIGLLWLGLQILP